MRTGRHFIEQLKKHGYNTESEFTTQCLLTRKEPDSIKAVIIVDGAFEDCVSDYGADHYRQMVAEKLHAEPKCLVVVFGDRKDSYFKKRNIIAFEQTYGKITYCNIEPDFFEEKQLLKRGLKAARLEKKEWEANVLSTTGRYQKSYTPVMPYIIVALNLLLFLKLGIFHSGLWGINPESVLRRGESYRLITYNFVHTGLWHLITNSISLIMIGSIYTTRNGNWDFLITSFIGGIVAGLISCIFRLPPTINQAYTVGASGAIFAVLGALFLDAIWHGVENKRRIITFAIVTLILSNLSFGVDRVCHIGGFFAGMGIFWVLSELSDIQTNLSFIRNKRRKETVLESKK